MFERPTFHAEQTPVFQGGRPLEIARRVNEKHNVASHCRKLPGRVQDVIEREGDRLPK